MIFPSWIFLVNFCLFLYNSAKTTNEDEGAATMPGAPLGWCLSYRMAPRWRNRRLRWRWSFYHLAITWAVRRAEVTIRGKINWAQWSGRLGGGVGGGIQHIHHLNALLKAGCNVRFMQMKLHFADGVVVIVINCDYLCSCKIKISAFIQDCKKAK